MKMAKVKYLENAAASLIKAGEYLNALEVLDLIEESESGADGIDYLRGAIYYKLGDNESAGYYASLELTDNPEHTGAITLKEKSRYFFKCSVCRNRTGDFVPLDGYYSSSIKKHGFPYSLDDFETLNYNYYLCPVCSASDRDRLYAIFIDEYVPDIPIRNKIKVLDFSPSPAFSEFMRNILQFEYISADIEKGYDIVLDITDMKSIRDKSIDLLISSHILEHVNSDFSALNEIYRVLKTGGKAIIMSPVCTGADKIDEDFELKDTAERWRRFGQDDHIRLYNKPGFTSRIKASGFELEELDKEYFGEEKLTKLGINHKSVLYVGLKKG